MSFEWSYYFLHFGSLKTNLPPDPQKYMSSFLCTSPTVSGKPVRPHCALEEAGLKQLLEKWSRNKIAILVGSNCDAGSAQRAEGWRALAKTVGRIPGHTL